MPNRTPSGTYAGRSACARRADRRARLVAAARSVWGSDGWAAVTMRGVCGRAGLVDRYFYESFPDRDALLVEVWDEERDRLVSLVVEAFAARADLELSRQLEAAVGVVVEHLGADPARARIVLGDHTGNPLLEPRRRQALRTFADVLVEWVGPRLHPDTDTDELRMRTLVGVGGFAELIAAWNAGELAVDAARIRAHATSVAERLIADYLPET